MHYEIAWSSWWYTTDDTGDDAGDYSEELMGLAEKDPSTGYLKIEAFQVIYEVVQEPKLLDQKTNNGAAETRKQKTNKKNIYKSL